MIEDKRMVIVRTVVCVLGLLSVGTGIGAELKLFKFDDIEHSQDGQPLPQQCVPLTSPPFLLGFTAAMALAIAHAIINVEAGCFCCRRPPRPSGSDNSFLALTLCFLPWSTFVLAFLLLLTGGALLNGENFEDIFSACYLVTSGVFLAGASFSFLSVCAGMLYYCLTVYSSNTARSARVIPPDQAGIEMGQTRLPAATAQDPVFVHEDTYMRRMFNL
ncbi:unnamed protein product [Rhodiola kirilowii]